ncbi:MAG: hypothetical protein IPK50_14020 [Fibrobacterota bacterium]|nr:hypothetical protein [Fibrobacterota bacterium]QQS03417.1 MAG: hypothetical protein IPK50_14020 [Fibrobacterota bacterium]
MPDRRSPFIRLVFLPLSVAGFLILLHRGCAEWREEKLLARGILLDRADSSFRIPTDSFFQRQIPSGKPLARDPVEFASKRSGWPIRARGTDSGWKWACLQTPDSGIVEFFAFDSGCATQHGQFWSDAMAVHWQAWDLVRKEGGPARHTTSTRSIWSYPGDDRMCLPTRADHPPDSVQALCGRPSFVRD